jgi:XapX domain-containing protein
MKIVIGILVGLGLGAFCRWFDIPLPSPPKVIGAVMVMAATLGYVATDQVLSRGQQKLDASGVAKVTATTCGQVRQ